MNIRLIVSWPSSKRDRRSIQLGEQRTRVSELSAERVEIKERRKSCESCIRNRRSARDFADFSLLLHLRSETFTFFIFTFTSPYFSFLLSFFSISCDSFFRCFLFVFFRSRAGAMSHKLMIIGSSCAILSGDVALCWALILSTFFSIVCEIESKQQQRRPSKRIDFMDFSLCVRRSLDIFFLHRWKRKRRMKLGNLKPKCILCIIKLQLTMLSFHFALDFAIIL